MKFLRVYFALAMLLGAVSAPAEVVTYPAPVGVAPSPDYTVTADGKPVFIQTVETLNGGPASFGGFDFSGSVEIEIKTARPASAGSVKVLPASWGITPKVEGQTIRLTLSQPRNLTLEVGGFERALHLFANPLEKDAPKAGDPGVIYFGPGVHDVTTMTLPSNTTLYLAGGAILKCKIGEGEKPTHLKDWSGMKNYRLFMSLYGVKNVRICGRGVIDMSALPWHARSGIVVERAEGVRIEGITILDAPAWTVAAFNSRDIQIENIKQLCRRENSDGIDLCNTQDATVRGCFMRNNDDEICVKTTMGAPTPGGKNILVEGCVIWNERARGLGITSETRRDISDVTFRDCDIIHDFSKGGDCAALAILVSDSGTMRNIRFENIRIEEARNTLIRCWVGKDMWGHDPERGHVSGAVFKAVTYSGAGQPSVRMDGCDATHLIENVTFENLKIGGKLIENAEQGKIKLNPFVRNVRFVTGR